MENNNALDALLRLFPIIQIPTQELHYLCFIVGAKWFVEVSRTNE